TNSLEVSSVLELADMDCVSLHASSNSPEIGPRDTSSRQLTAPHRGVDEFRCPEVIPNIVKEVPHRPSRATEVSSLAQRVKGYRTRTSSTSPSAPGRGDDSSEPRQTQDLRQRSEPRSSLRRST